MKKKGGLGRGFDVLFDDNTTSSGNSSQTLRISEIEPNKEQPRRAFDEDSLAALADSIKQHGLLQPILVRPYKDSYQIVAGERRWRACRMLGMNEIPVIINEMSDLEVAQVAIIENLQREDLNPIEEAQGYYDLIEKYSMTQDQVAKTVGKARSSITNALRLLSLPDDVRIYLEDGEITRGHAKALLAISDTEKQRMLAKQAAEGNLTVRAIERASQEQATTRRKSVRITDSFFTEMQLALTESLGKRVKIDKEGKRITLRIDCSSQEELKDLAEKLTK